MSREHMDSFREAKREMGFKHTSAYVPRNRMADFSLYVERLKAERMLEICSLDPTSRERETLANRNIIEVPTVQEVTSIVERYSNQPAITKQAKLCIESLEKSNSTLNVGKLSEPGEEWVKWTSLAVAHNHMANILWRELAQMVHQLETHKQ
jgi:hypothetical protein